jgi:hypothetical protein
MFSFQQKQRRRGQNRFYLEAEGWPVGWGLGGGGTMYTHVSKCKNDKIIGEEKNKINIKGKERCRMN